MTGSQRTPTASRTLRAKRLGRQGVRSWGRMTQELRVLPNVLIVGAQRSGTTSLHRWLASHPQAFPPVRHKGVHYFDVNAARDLGWYRGHFPTRTTVARAAAGAAESRAVVFETSPYYLYHPAAASRIAQRLPGVRAIAVLRDPVERAYSAWAHEAARGFEDLDFASALDAEGDRLAGTTALLGSDPRAVSLHHQHHAYVDRGRYLHQLRRLAHEIGRDQLLVIDFARMAEEPDAVQRDVLAFLGLADAASGRLPHANARPRHDLDPSLRTRLRRQYADEDAALTAWLGWTPSWLGPDR